MEGVYASINQPINFKTPYNSSRQQSTSKMLELLLKIQSSVSKFTIYNTRKKKDALDMTARPPSLQPCAPALDTVHCTAAQRPIASIHKAMAKQLRRLPANPRPTRQLQQKYTYIHRKDEN
jgi:hypothetical protein